MLDKMTMIQFAADAGFKFETDNSTGEIAILPDENDLSLDSKLIKFMEYVERNVRYNTCNSLYYMLLKKHMKTRGDVVEQCANAINSWEKKERESSKKTEVCW